MLLDRKRALAELGIPEEMYNELLQDFVAETESALHNLFEAIQSGNRDDIASSAHFIKGSSGNLRIDDLYVLAKEIEFDARTNKDTAVMAQNASKLKASFEELKKII